MAGKKKSEKESSWIGEIEKYSRQIWLAGLGAYSKVSKDGSKLFETLVKDGEKAEKEAKSDVDAQVGAAKASAALRRARSTRFGIVRSASGASSRKPSTSV
ncbi:poly(3-hydroxyalkanoate) granule-associated protein PhaI [Pseudomonas aeruginosa]|nr:poly(3-hydroxyalkanoate) granule-associated protein PhaI [Pseudomonas aeruginosa]